MATTTMDNTNRQLLIDLRKTFPEIPENVVIQVLKQFHNNRNACFDALQQVRQRYAYGPFESASGSISNNLRGLQHKDERGRGLSQPGIEMRPPDLGYPRDYSHSYGMSQSRSEPHLAQGTCHSPPHQGRPPEYSESPAYYTDFTLAMRQHPAPPPPTIPYPNSGQMNFSQDARFQFAQQPQPPPYSMSTRPPAYNTNGANYTYTTGASDANNPGIKQEWTSQSSAMADPQRSSSPYVNYPAQGSPYASPRPDPKHRTENRTNFPHAASQPNLPPLYIDTNNPHPTRQFLNMYGSQSPHNSRSQSPVVNNPLQMTLPQQPPPYGMQNHHNQGAHTPGSEPGTPPVYFPQTNSTTNVFFQPVPPSRMTSSNSTSSDQSLLTSSDPHEQFVHQQPIQPAILSPSSSQSSLNDIEGRTSRSNSTDDVAYTQALILHQKARKEKLEKEVERYRAYRDQLSDEVCAMEIEIAQRKSNRNKDYSVTADDLVQLRETNRQLQVNVQCLVREVDSFEAGQAQPPVNENFYSNMSSTGQAGTLRPPPSGVIESLQSVPRLPINSQQEQQRNDEEQWACSACTFLNHPALDKCECCEFPRLPHGQGPG